MIHLIYFFYMLQTVFIDMGFSFSVGSALFTTENVLGGNNLLSACIIFITSYTPFLIIVYPWWPMLILLLNIFSKCIFILWGFTHWLIVLLIFFWGQVICSDIVFGLQGILCALIFLWNLCNPLFDLFYCTYDQLFPWLLQLL